MRPLLKVDDLSTYYWTGEEPVRAVRHVSFEVRPGEVVGVVGESGSGKTTLALSLLRLIRAPGRIVSGAVLFDGENLFKRPRVRMRQIRGARMSLIPQAALNAIDPVFRIRRAVAEVIRTHQPVPWSQAEERASDLLEAVRLPRERHDAYPHEFSGGMRQRVVIAMALANEPDLVLADEPVTGLDVIVQAQILELLREVRAQRGLAMVLISHDLHVVGSVADTLIVMRDGEVVEQGPTSSLLHQPSHPYTADLLAAAPRLEIPDEAAVGEEPRAPGPSAPGSSLEQGRKAPLLDLEDVTLSFVDHRRGRRRTVPAADGVNLAVQRGQTLGLVGESGSGKTTIARLILGLIKPDRGAIRLDGTDLVPLSETQLRQYRRRMHLVFQDPYAVLSPRMPVLELVAEPLAIHGLRTGRWKERVCRALEESELRPATRYLDRYPAELSGGQRQRVALARALVTRPQLLVADEPTSMLDASVRRDLLETMRAIRDRHDLGLVFITHDLGLAHDFCDEVVVLFRGRIVERGPARLITTVPHHPYTQALVRAVRDLEPPMEGTFTGSAFEQGCCYRLRCPVARDICSQSPPLRETAAGHHVACHLSPEETTPPNAAWS